MGRQTAAEIRAKIEEIEATLDAGITSTDVDGIKVSVSIDALRIRRAELQAQLAKLEGDVAGQDRSPFRRLTL